MKGQKFKKENFHIFKAGSCQSVIAPFRRKEIVFQYMTKHYLLFLSYILEEDIFSTLSKKSLTFLVPVFGR
jgi:hypothetical protein